jgi:assimilatory nitrate reductase electron transfer subunit
LIFNFARSTVPAHLVGRLGDPGWEPGGMIVCHCNGVSDRTIRRALRTGCRTRGEIARACGAGRGCGGCREVIDEVMASESSAPVREAFEVSAEPASAA